MREELIRLRTVEERHSRLAARVSLMLGLTVVVWAAGTALVWDFERGAKGTEVHDLGDAAFFAAVQILTVSSSLPNPLTTAGRVVDVVLELWAVFVVTALAGSFAGFFRAGDAG